MRKLSFPFWLAGARLRRRGGSLVLVVLGSPRRPRCSRRCWRGRRPRRTGRSRGQVSELPAKVRAVRVELVQRRRPGRAVREARRERSRGSSSGCCPAGRPARRSTGSTSSAGRCSASAPLTTSAAGCISARAVCRGSAGREHCEVLVVRRGGPITNVPGPPARPGRRGRPAHGDAVRRRDPVAGPGRVGLRREDPPLPPAGAAAARARKRRRRARPLAGPARRLPQLRLGGAAAARHGALVVGRGSGGADRAGAHRLPGIELRLRADRAHGRAARRGRLGAPRRSTPAAARR